MIRTRDNPPLINTFSHFIPKMWLVYIVCGILGRSDKKSIYILITIKWDRMTPYFCGVFRVIRRKKIRVPKHYILEPIRYIGSTRRGLNRVNGPPYGRPFRGKYYLLWGLRCSEINLVLPKVTDFHPPRGP